MLDRTTLPVKTRASGSAVLALCREKSRTPAPAMPAQWNLEGRGVLVLMGATREERPILRRGWARAREVLDHIRRKMWQKKSWIQVAVRGYGNLE